MISIRAITEDNFDAILAMKRPDGEGFVVSNAVSLAQCWLYRENEDVFPCAIYREEEPVGFLLLEEDMDDRELIVWRMMFPEEHANKGYGGEALRRVIQLARESGKYHHIELTCHPKNTRARHMYEKLGFCPTGKILNGEDELMLNL